MTFPICTIIIFIVWFHSMNENIVLILYPGCANALHCMLTRRSIVSVNHNVEFVFPIYVRLKMLNIYIVCKCLKDNQ